MSANQESDDYADQAISVLLERALAGRRVLWIGEWEGGAPERLAGVAESLVVLDTSGSRPRRRARGVQIRAYRDDAIELFDESFDAAVVTDVEALGREADARLAEIAEKVRGGPVLVGRWAESEEAYGAFVTLLEEIFGAVRVLGQATFKAFALADLAADAADEIVVDGSLVAGGEPTRFLALCAKEDLDIAAYTIVQVPRLTAPDATILLDTEDRGTAENSSARLEAAEEHAEALEGALASRAKEVAELRISLEEAQAALEGAEVALEEAASAPAPTPTVPSEPLDEKSSGDFEPAYDVIELEAKLAERARRLAELEREIVRRGVVARDVIEQLWEINARGPEVADVHAVERAVRAEAELSAARFEMDELRARLNASSVPVDDGASEENERRLAALSGRARGLEARLAEESEQHETAAARLELALADLEDARAGSRRLEADGAMARERFEVELIRAREASRRVEKVEGSVDALNSEIEGLRASEARLSERVGTLSGSLMATRDLLQQRERELEDARRGMAPAPAGGGGDALGEEVTRIAEEKEKLSEAVASRDALVTRLQMDLAEVESAALRSGDRLTELTDENARLKRAVVDASTSVEAREAAERRLAELEAKVAEQAGLRLELERARADVDSLRQARSEGLEALRETRGILVGIDGAMAGGGRASTAVDLAAPDSNWDEGRTSMPAIGASDAEMMLRSLTAQLEARNDRVRALEQMVGGAVGADGEAAGAATLELEARIERIGTELEDERERRQGAERALEDAIRSVPSDAELKELRSQLAAGADDLEAMTGRAATFERDIDSLRDVCSETQNGLDALLDAATSSGNPQLAERVAALLSVLGRF